MLKYPKTKKENIEDNFFDQKVKDPYRWLENDQSIHTKNWVKSQNEVTQLYVNQITYRGEVEDRLKKIWNFEKISAPFTEGDYTYYFKNDGLQNQSILYRHKSSENPNLATEFINPNKFSEQGTTSLGSLSFSENGKYLVYSISEGGSDWKKIIVIDVETKKQIGGTLDDHKFSGISWLKNEGFYYSKYHKPKGSEHSAKTDQHLVYYHKVGSQQYQDQLIFGESLHQKHRYCFAKVSENNKYLFVYAQESTSGNKLLFKKIDDNSAKFQNIINHTKSDTYVLRVTEKALFLSTNLNAPNRRIVVTPLDKTSPENWVDIIPETKNPLSASTAGNYIIANYMIDAISKIIQYDFEGNLIREITLPGLGTASGFSAKATKKELYYSFSNYKTPSSIYHYNLNTGISVLHHKPSVKFKSEDYVSKQVFYNSKDGTKIPMIITHKKELTLDGKNPTILYGYGGFNVSLTPSFNIANVVWLEQGGVYAVPNLRGGGEYGKEWHLQGTKLNKQNVFDDFIAAANYLIQNNYTSSNFLAIKGGSNGGLLVGAVMTQRPDLMRVALPAVGVLDMLRYHKFTAGAGWAYDYGTADDNLEMFKYLKSYSPLHNVKPKAKYPATLITTGDHDDRVVPAHSYKFAATLQENQGGSLPTLIRIETDGGHGAGTPVHKTIAALADIYSFTFFNMGFTQLPLSALKKD